MRGTEKQIVWAKDIQARHLAETLRYCSKANGVANSPGFFEIVIGLEEDARFWIDNRDSDVSKVLAGIRSRHAKTVRELMALCKQRFDTGLSVDRDSLLNAYGQITQTREPMEFPF